MLYCIHDTNEYELQSHNYILFFFINTLEKVMNILTPSPTFDKIVLLLLFYKDDLGIK